MNSFEVLDSFVAKVQALASESGIEVKTDGRGLTMWPTFKADGGLDQWVAIYLKLPSSYGAK
jgi:hypothetical protein